MHEISCASRHAESNDSEIISIIRGRFKQALTYRYGELQQAKGDSFIHNMFVMYHGLRTEFVIFVRNVTLPSQTSAAAKATIRPVQKVQSPSHTYAKLVSFYDSVSLPVIPPLDHRSRLEEKETYTL